MFGTAQAPPRGAAGVEQGNKQRHHQESTKVAEEPCLESLIGFQWNRCPR